jgi:hypothetical protein
MKFTNKFIIAFFAILLFMVFVFIIYKQKNHENFDNVQNEMPFVIICWNNLTFVKNFVNQLKKYKRKIIILNNNSDYPPLYDYFIEIKKELGDLIEIRSLDKNYGHTVYRELSHTLPDVYMLSDPDLELNPKLPDNFAEILYDLSNKHKIYKVGFALDLSDKDKFLTCKKYTNDKGIYEWEKQFWQKKINDDTYELYHADVDTTFALINNAYYKGNNYEGIRIAGNFTAKHLPWYTDYIKNNIPPDEVHHWKKNNKSSSLLFSCLNE